MFARYWQPYTKILHVFNIVYFFHFGAFWLVQTFIKLKKSGKFFLQVFLCYIRSEYRQPNNKWDVSSTKMDLFKNNIVNIIFFWYSVFSFFHTSMKTGSFERTWLKQNKNNIYIPQLQSDF